MFNRSHWMAWSILILVVAGLTAALVETGSQAPERIGTKLKTRVDNELAMEANPPPPGALTASPPADNSWVRPVVWTGMVCLMVVVTLAVVEAFLASIVIEDEARPRLTPPLHPPDPVPHGHHKVWSETQIQAFRHRNAGT